MKRYFFNLSDGGWEPDRIGTDLRDDAAAKQAAVRFVGEVLQSEPNRLDEGTMRVDVHDETHSLQFAVIVKLATDQDIADWPVSVTR